MADDDIERLLREVNATTGQSGQGSSPSPVAKRAKDDVATSEASAGGRVAFGVVAAGVTGLGALAFGIFTPWTDALDMGFAAAVAAFLTGVIAGPPRWFSS
jgi:hypothetical protein